MQNIYNSFKKGLRRIYDQVVHGYDTTRNVLVKNDGNIVYIKDIKFNEKEEYRLNFPTEFAKAVTKMYSKGSLEKKTDNDQQL